MSNLSRSPISAGERRIKITINPGKKGLIVYRRLAQALRRVGFEPFHLLDARHRARYEATDGICLSYCALVSLFEPLPHFAVFSDEGWRAVAIASSLLPKLGVQPPRCTFRVIRGGGRTGQEVAVAIGGEAA